MPLDAKEFEELHKKIKADTEEAFQKSNTELQKNVETRVNAAVEKAMAGSISKSEMEAEVKKATDEYSKKATDLEQKLHDQGEVLRGMKEKMDIKQEERKTILIEDIVKENAPALKKLQKDGSGFITVNVKAAGITSVSNSIQAMTSPPTSPYAPGLGNQPLTLYDILRNPNFVSNYVNTGNTNASVMAWINETSLQGLPAITAEGGQKPLTQRQFQVEFSRAKKIAAYIQLTDEFDKDLDYLSSEVRRLLQTDVLRAYDDQIQQDVINNATPFSFNANSLGNNSLVALQHAIYDATYWDALMTLQTMIRLANFIPNVSLINPVLWTKMMSAKDTVGRYNYPAQEVINAINPIQGNKIFQDNAISGDLKQFNVMVYEDFQLKMGWINDDLIRNQFTIVGEIRFHDYISAARKAAIVYANAKWVAEQINSASNVIIGS